MRLENRFLVMRLAPMIGRPTSALRVSVYHRAATLDWAVKVARDALTDTVMRGPREPRGAYWIVAAGKPAHRGKR